MREVDAAAGLVVRDTTTVPGASEARAKLVRQRVPGLLAEKDPTLWGERAEPEASIRLGWVDTVRRSRELLPVLAKLREELADLDHVVLAGMGGSSLAPEVIARTLGKRLTVLDTTDPYQVSAALADRLDRTVVVVSSKSGSTVETDSHRRAYWQAFEDAGISDIGRRFVMVTDPGSALEATARQMGAHLVLADPDVGGRYSALSMFGIVPAALAGFDVAGVLESAIGAAEECRAEHGNGGPVVEISGQGTFHAGRQDPQVRCLANGLFERAGKGRRLAPHEQADPFAFSHQLPAYTCHFRPLLFNHKARSSTCPRIWFPGRPISTAARSRLAPLSACYSRHT